ncbi:MAG: hypothetical protein L6300_03945, partial [Syntrophaceae bacterium]|nr:hypothetical protein [Pseudomonadota bacterium]MCG2739375.1 hypothetical protein [Syntrophaceae bacterium]
NRVRMLEERNRQLGLLGDMVEMLQMCIRREEAFGLIGPFLEGIFPRGRGALYVKDENRRSLQHGRGKPHV